MILLTTTSDKLQIITASTGSIKPHVSWVDNAAGVITYGRTNTAAVASATTTDVLAAPGASTVRNAKFISVRNDHASTSNLVTIQHTDGTTVHPLWQGTLLAGESVNFNEGQGWQYCDANGNPKLAATKLDTWLHVTSDYTNSTTSFTAITGLSAAVVSGKKYMLEAHLYGLSAATTTGIQMAIGNVAMTSIIATALQVITNSTSAATVAAGTVAAVDTAAGATGTASVTATLNILSAQFTPSAAGTVQVKAASEVGASQITIKQGSWVHIRELDN